MNNKKKILLISNMYPSKNYPYYGIFVKNTEDMLLSLGYKIDRVVITKSSNSFFKLINYIVFYIKSFFYSLFFKYDYIYIHFASLSSLSVYYAKKIKRQIRVIVNIHGNDLIPDVDKDIKRLKYTEKILNSATKIVVPSVYFKDFLFQEYTYLKAKVYIFPSGGVQLDVFKKRNKDEILNLLKLDQKFRYIGYVSRLEKDKGWDIFLEMFSALKLSHKDVKAVMVGSGSEEDALNRKIESLELKKDIIRYQLLSQSEVAKIYNILDVFCFPTYRKSESLGLVGLEAMASQCVIVGSNMAGPKTYIQDGINGFLFQPMNIDDLYDKVNYCLSLEKDIKEHIGQKALEKAKEFDQKSLINKLKEIISEK